MWTQPTRPCSTFKKLATLPSNPKPRRSVHYRMPPSPGAPCSAFSGALALKLGECFQLRPALRQDASERRAARCRSSAAERCGKLTRGANAYQKEKETSWKVVGSAPEERSFRVEPKSLLGRGEYANWAASPERRGCGKPPPPRASRPANRPARPFRDVCI